MTKEKRPGGRPKDFFLIPATSGTAKRSYFSTSDSRPCKKSFKNATTVLSQFPDGRTSSASRDEVIENQMKTRNVQSSVILVTVGEKS